MQSSQQGAEGHVRKKVGGTNVSVPFILLVLGGQGGLSWMSNYTSTQGW